ncbi:flagellar motor switch phosphatase FliY [Petroclostridium xylanilyticum]|uniref:flagellar motor switch phosphatase FliY n=1 Tax=Petroclostridium xylanilyticum TaxID=1792311 RepID=UPI000B9915CA|nr:flagellar motor switch phosphatase FliY [Petroclostridium xylanilyticum]
MSEMLSQAEIDALLNGTMDFDISNNEDEETFTAEEADALGEVGNISMGTSATTLFTLLGQKVLITTPKVTVTDWDSLAAEHTIPYVAVKVEYTEGLKGTNLLILKEQDVKIITDLMMGGDGSNTSGELTELHLSAIGEAMNQMIGSSATSLSSMLNKKIDISPPNAFVIDFASDFPFETLGHSQKIVKVAFRMVIGNLIDSEIMQLIPLDFAKNLVHNLLQTQEEPPAQQPPAAAKPSGMQKQQEQRPSSNLGKQSSGGMEMSAREYNVQPPRTPVNVQPVQFQSFEENRMAGERENISLIMDVPLEVTVELGRTQRLIKDILEFVPGSIIELDKLAGEPIDILVNGKIIAKGEVVVIDESFGVRITDIVNPSKRL